MSEAMGLGPHWEVKELWPLQPSAIILHSFQSPVLEGHPTSCTSWLPQDLSRGCNMPGVAWDRTSCLLPALGTRSLNPDLKLGQVTRGVCVGGGGVWGWTAPFWVALLLQCCCLLQCSLLTALEVGKALLPSTPCHLDLASASEQN